MPVYAYFGPAGTFTEMALENFLADGGGAAGNRTGLAQPTRVPALSPGAAIGMVRSGEADFACVPIESSLEGSVPATMDALVPATPESSTSAAQSHVQVVAETMLPIAFTVAAAADAGANTPIRRIAAYPVAAAQVRDSVEKLYPGAEFVIASSNAGAAMDVAAGRADAAVTTPPAARIAGLRVLTDGVSDARDAQTRFLLVGAPTPPPARTGHDRTGVILELPNVPGSLMSAMSEFAVRDLDLTRIESRPRRDADGTATGGRYRFFLDVVGHVDDEAVAEALAALHRRADRVVFLGSWPACRDGGEAPPCHGPARDWLDSIRRGVR